MNIELYTCTDPDNKLEKTPALVKTITGDLHGDTSLTKPSFRCYGAYESGVNYVHVPLLNRWYYVEEVSLVNNKIFELHCSCDVLQSFKSYLTSDNVKVYDKQTRVYSDQTPFKTENIIIATIEGVR
jgi:hypothetical protein